MIRLIATSVLLFFSSLINFTYSQYCGPITASHTFVHDNLQFNILNGTFSMNELNYKIGIGPEGDMDTREYGSLIKSSQIWAGGVDPNGSLKLAVANSDDTDWFMGPLDEHGQTNVATCEAWDRIFSVKKEEIIAARKVFDEGGSCEEISEAILNWPGNGNPNIEMPSGYRGAEFYDENDDGVYDPCGGDFPMVHIPTHYHFHYLEYVRAMPSQISYYVMNDNGGPHNASNATAIQIQMGVYIFSFKMHDIEDVIYVKYEIENRATDDIRDFYVGNRIDFEIGCGDNDYVGTDSIRNMVYAYNSDQEDQCSTDGELSSSQVGMLYQGLGYVPYKIEVIDGEIVLVDPLFGWDADTLVLRKMSSSIIPVNCDNNNCDYTYNTQYYQHLRGLSKDGSPILNKDGNVTKMMFTGDPSDPNSWSLCNEDSKPETTSISAMGPFLLQPSAHTEMLQVFMHAPEVGDGSGCGSNAFLKQKQERVESFFHRGFYHQIGPPPPTITTKQVNEGLLLSISNVPTEFSEPVQTGNKFFPEKYNFEGVKIYQVKSENFDLTEINNINLSRLIYQGDIENGVDELYNWYLIPNPDSNQPPIWVPERQVDGADEGIVDEFLFDRDEFTGLPPVIGEEYYFIAFSYGYNNYKQFDPYDSEGEFGQESSYVESTCGLNVINSQAVLSSTEIRLDQNYIFESFGLEWQINNVESDLQISLISSSGQLINKLTLNRGDIFSSEILEALPNGIYFVRVFDEKSQKIKAHKVISIN